MAVTQHTDKRVIVYGQISAKEYEFTFDSVRADAVLLTKEYLQQRGANAYRNGDDWDIELQLMSVTSGAEAGISLASIGSMTMTIWDPIDLTVIDTWTDATEITPDANQSTNPGLFAIAKGDTDTALTVGCWKFAIEIEWTDGGDVTREIEGWIDVLPATPT